LHPGTQIEIVDVDVDRDVPGGVQDAWQEAWSMRPELRSLRAKRQAMEAQLQIARSEKRPQVGLWARAEVVRPTFYPETGTVSGGVMATQSILDGGTARAAIREAQARLDQLAAADEQLRYGIAVQVQAAHNQIVSSLARVQTTSRSAELASEALRLAQLGYANGVTPMLDLLQAQAALTKADADHEASLSALKQAFVEYDYATGVLAS